MPVVEIRRVISERFNVTEEEAKQLLRWDGEWDRSDSQDVIWEWFCSHETGTRMIDIVNVKIV